MLSEMQQKAMSSGATAGQVDRKPSNLYTDAEVWALYQAGRQNYPSYTDEQLINLGLAQYGISKEQANRVIHGSHANGLYNVPFDNYVANLHKGETVIPERQATIFRSMEPAFKSMAGQDDVAEILNRIYAAIIAGNRSEDSNGGNGWCSGGR